jgi:plasmid maintenance system antidote protein VapI
MRRSADPVLVAQEQIGVTADTALRLSKAFGTTPELANNFDVAAASRVSSSVRGD